jgi:cytochrome c oxidase subunit II
MKMRFKNHNWIFLLMVVMALYYPNIQAASRFNMPEGVTPISHSIYGLHMLIFYICVIIAAIVFSAMGYIFYKHRKSKGAVAAQFRDHTILEIVWTIIPTLILIGMAIPATKVLIKMHDMQKTDINIKITGMQWRWKYEYLDEGISFLSNLSTPQRQLDGYEPKGKWYLREVDHPLVIPIHKKVRFLVTSSDVMHSWWVPAFGVKRDAIPGLITTAWAKVERPGIYRGNCTELCGMHHGYMPVVVYAVTDQDYHKWLEYQKTQHPLPESMLQKMVQHSVQQKYTAHIKQATPKTEISKALMTPSKKTQRIKQAKPSTEISKALIAPSEKTQLMAQGKKIYTQYCAVCHKATGKGMPPAFKALKGSAIVTGPKDAVIHTVLNGVKGSAMQAFSTVLSNDQLAAVITYIRQSWGNDDQKKYGRTAGGLITTHDIKHRRKA